MGAQLLLRVIYSFVAVCVLSNSVSFAAVAHGEVAEPEADVVTVQCANDEMQVTIEPALSPLPPVSRALYGQVEAGAFSGMVYPRGLSKNSSCLVEYVRQKGALHYRLPLASCNTMSTDLPDGGVEYFNTIVVQPHLKLVTSQGRGYHVRCRYETREKSPVFIVNSTAPGVQQLTAALIGAEAMPGCTMRIYAGDASAKHVAENVRIGDPLSLVINIDKQEKYGIMISDCLVRDGLGWGEQRLLNKQGCPLNTEIMGPFTYTEDLTKATVSFPAHKFPYTASVYYQCHVRLCNKKEGECEIPTCNKNGNSVRRRRQDSGDEGSPATIEVYSGLYVNEGTESAKSDLFDEVSRERTPDDPDSFCISQRSFALGVAIAGLILMLLVLAAVCILIARRRARRHKESSTSGSSLYSGPYTNTAYSHSS